MVDAVTWDGPPASPTSGDVQVRPQAMSLREEIMASYGPANSSGHAPDPLAGFRQADLLLAILADPAAFQARKTELEGLIAEANKRLNAAAAAEARAAKAQAKLEAEKAAHAEKAKAEWKLIADTKAWAEHEKSDWARDNAEIVEKARRWDRLQPPSSIDLSAAGRRDLARLNSGEFAHLGQREEAEATKRRSAADLHAERLVAATPEVQFPAGTSISRDRPARRG
jgi:hypothetical protein